MNQKTKIDNYTSVTNPLPKNDNEIEELVKNNFPMPDKSGWPNYDSIEEEDVTPGC